MLTDAKELLSAMAFTLTVAPVVLAALMLVLVVEIICVPILAWQIVRSLVHYFSPVWTRRRG